MSGVLVGLTMLSLIVFIGPFAFGLQLSLLECKVAKRILVRRINFILIAPSPFQFISRALESSATMSVQIISLWCLLQLVK